MFLLTFAQIYASLRPADFAILTGRGVTSNPPFTPLTDQWGGGCVRGVKRQKRLPDFKSVSTSFVMEDKDRDANILAPQVGHSPSSQRAYPHSPLAFIFFPPSLQ